MTIRLIAITLSLALGLCGSIGAQAKKPENPGNNGKGNPHQEQYSQGHYNQQDNREKGHSDEPQSADYHLADSFFTDSRRHIISDYYGREIASGHCPPGLAKKNNGCQPPGRAKQWRRGYPLPGDVVYHDVPSALLHQLGHTPEGHKIVRVGTDLLLISIGTGMVVDAIDDLDDIF